MKRKYLLNSLRIAAVALIVAMLLPLSLSLPVLAASENFTTFTEVDSGSDITVAAAQVDFDTMDRGANSYVYKDFEAAHFGDFEHLLEINVSAKQAGGTASFWSIANQSNQTIADIIEADAGFMLYEHEDNYLVLQEGDATNQDFMASSAPYTYWVTIQRSGTTLTCKIYNDPDRAIGHLVDTLTLTVAATTFRYLSVSGSKEAGSGATITGYSKDLDIQEAGVSAPTVTTNATESVEETTATASGNITNTNGENATIVYFEYDTDTGAPYANSENVSDDYGVGEFNINLTGLTKGELYYGRAGAENSGGTGWGSEVSWIQKPDPASSFIVTDNASDNMSFSWTNGTGMDSVTLRYAEGGTAPAGIGDGILGYTGTGTSCTVIGLDAETQYSARLFTQASEGALTSTADSNPTASGTTDSVVIPTLTVDEVTVYGDTWALVSANITATGGENCTVWFIQYGELEGGVYTDNVSHSGSKGVSSWSDNITGLTPGTAYMYRSGATNSAGTGYSDEGEYVEDTPPTVTVSAASSIEATTATLNGNVTDTGGENPTVTVYWGDNDGGSTPGNWDHNSAPTSPSQPQGVAAFYLNATGLPPGTTIYYNARAVNSEGTDWATTGSFLTKPAAPINVFASDGSSTAVVTVTWTKSTGATTYDIYRNGALIDSVGDVATYDDSTAAAPTITAGASVASDGTYSGYVALSLSGTSANNGTTYTYGVIATNATGDSVLSVTNTGYRGVGALTYQWQRSAADSDAAYSNITGATTAAYNDTAAPEDGDGRYYKCTLNATGASQQISAANRGYRGEPAPVLPASTWIPLVVLMGLSLTILVYVTIVSLYGEFTVRSITIMLMAIITFLATLVFILAAVNG